MEFSTRSVISRVTTSRECTSTVMMVITFLRSLLVRSLRTCRQSRPVVGKTHCVRRLLLLAADAGSEVVVVAFLRPLLASKGT